MNLTLLLPILIQFVKGLPLQNSVQINLGAGGTSNSQQTLPSLLEVIAGRSKGREHAVLEFPSLKDKTGLIYDYAHQFVADILHPKPIVDTISEHEKYGNIGDQFRLIGNAIVGGYEGFSQFINSAVDVPFEAMKQITRKASSFISSMGAKFVGL